MRHKILPKGHEAPFTIATVNNLMHADKVIEHLDDLLHPHDFEVVMFADGSGGTTLTFGIDRRKDHDPLDADASLGESILEQWAIKLALGNNGGTWATSYTEEQKKLWRQRAGELLDQAYAEARADLAARSA